MLLVAVGSGVWLVQAFWGEIKEFVLDLWPPPDVRQQIKGFSETAAHFATALAALAAGWWFLFSASFRKKIQFDIQCLVFGEPRWGDSKLVELSFLLTNRGQVENRCYTLAYEIQSIDYLARKNSDRAFFRSGNIVPPRAEYYYVRAGVTLRITARKWIPANISTIRVKAFILHRHHRRDISPKEDLFDQMYSYPDWIAVDRVFSISSPVGMPAAPPCGTVPTGMEI